MIFQSTTMGGGVEILASKDFQAIPVKVAVPGTGTVVKAGTPLTAAGESTTGSNAIGILLYDVDTAKNPNGSAVVIGIIDALKAQNHSGVTYNASNLKAALPGIVLRDNVRALYDNAALSGLAIGALTLTPTFAKGTYNYTAETTASTNAVTVTLDDENATAVIKNGTTTVTNGGNASWSAGPNTLTVTVTAEDGMTVNVYTVTVTKS